MNNQQHPAVLIEKAWQTRVNASPEAALRPMIELKDHLGIPSRILDRETVVSLLSRSDARDVIDVLALHISVTAQIGEREQALSLLKILETEALLKGISDNFYLNYERGRMEFQSGDFTRAIESFMRASLIAGSPLQRIWASVNVVFCLENLGLPLEPSWSEVKHQLSKLETSELSNRIIEQLKTVELRMLFRQGKIRELLKWAEKDKQLDQGCYYGMWVRSLPFHRLFSPIVFDALTQLSSTGSSLMYRSSRLRTLQGLLHPEDFEITKPSEHVDRFYLWVWQWMQNPQVLSAEKITALTQRINFSELSHRITVEDGQLLRNAFAWLSLFDPASERRLKLLAGLCGRGRPSEESLYALEYLITQYLEAVRDGNRILESDYLRSLVRHPLWNATDLTFKQLVGSATGNEKLGSLKKSSALFELAERIRSLISTEQTGKQTGKRKGLVVFESRSQILILKTGKTLISQPLTRAFCLFHRQKAVSCQEFVDYCFGLHTYDPNIHNGKIFNLLTRLKHLAGDSLHFRMKQGYLSAEGTWRNIVITSGDIPPKIAANEAAYAPTILNSPKKHLILPVWSGFISRRDLEKRLDRPRSTTNRLIKHWINEGRIRRQGNSRVSRYVYIGLDSKTGSYGARS